MKAESDKKMGETYQKLEETDQFKSF